MNGKEKVFILFLSAFPFLVCAEEGGAGIPDIRSVEADLLIPALSENGDKRRAGLRFRYTHQDWSDTGVYAVVYLPTDWKPGGKFPVVAEFPGNGGFRNKFGDTCNGRPEGCKLGYGISGGKGLIWVSLPFVNGVGDDLAIHWWGDEPNYDPDATVIHTKKMVQEICEKFGGDQEQVILAGFSRGAIACNFIGLYDDEISGLWCGMVAFSHYDGVREGWPYPNADRASAFRRLKRLGHRPQFICHEAGARKNSDLEASRKYLDGTQSEGKFTFVSTGFRNHNDAWVLRPSHARKHLREWVKRLIQ